MEKNQNLNLNKLSKKELTNPEMNRVRGGQYDTRSCYCGWCSSSDCGGNGSGSSMHTNGNCNNCSGKESTCISNCEFESSECNGC